MIPDLGGQSSINLDWLFDVCLERAHRLRSRHWMCPSLFVSIPSALINLNTSEKLGNPRQRHSLMQALYGTENPDITPRKFAVKYVTRGLQKPASWSID